jgi:hypothetical protein
MYRLPHLFGHLQKRMDVASGVEYAWFNNVETKPGIGYPKDWENQDRWNGGWERKKNGKIQPKQGGKWRTLANISPIRICHPLMIITSRSPSITSICTNRQKPKPCQRRAQFGDYGQENG